MMELGEGGEIFFYLMQRAVFMQPRRDGGRRLVRLGIASIMWHGQQCVDVPLKSAELLCGCRPWPG